MSVGGNTELVCCLKELQAIQVRCVVGGVLVMGEV